MKIRSRVKIKMLLLYVFVGCCNRAIHGTLGTAIVLCRRQFLGTEQFCSVPIISITRGREGDEPVFGQVTYISICIVSKLLVITPIFSSILPLKRTLGFLCQIKLNTDDTI